MYVFGQSIELDDRVKRLRRTIEKLMNKLEQAKHRSEELQSDHDLLVEMLGKRVVLDNFDPMFMDTSHNIKLRLELKLNSELFYSSKHADLKEEVLLHMLKLAVTKVLRPSGREEVIREELPIPTYCQVCDKKLGKDWWEEDLLKETPNEPAP